MLDAAEEAVEKIALMPQAGDAERTNHNKIRVRAHARRQVLPRNFNWRAAIPPELPVDAAKATSLLALWVCASPSLPLERGDVRPVG